MPPFKMDTTEQTKQELREDHSTAVNLDPTDTYLPSTVRHSYRSKDRLLEGPLGRGPRTSFTLEDLNEGSE